MLLLGNMKGRARIYNRFFSSEGKLSQGILKLEVQKQCLVLISVLFLFSYKHFLTVQNLFDVLFNCIQFCEL